MALERRLRPKKRARMRYSRGLEGWSAGRPRSVWEREEARVWVVVAVVLGGGLG